MIAFTGKERDTETGLGTTNALTEKWSYNPKRLQPYDIRLGTATVDTSHGQWEYSYCAGGAPGSDCSGNNGNVMHQRVQPLNKVQNYLYDAVNRLSRMEEAGTIGTAVCTSGSGNPCRDFAYDRWGNMYLSTWHVVGRNHSRRLDRRTST